MSMTALTRWVPRLALAALVLLLTACAGLPAMPPRVDSRTLLAPADAPLAGIAADAGVPAEQTGVRALPSSAYALDARLALIRAARVSLDVQTYLIGNDATGRLILRELSEAAARGVRVRLLVDDLYTDGLTALLQGFAAQGNVEVRLFNPFVYGRDNSALRMLNLLGDFGRLNHRMHNKLLVADGVSTIVGGRNLADEYFFRSQGGNFIDFDVLAVGALVPQLSGYFDQYWNSEMAWPLQALAPSRLSTAERQALFAQLTDASASPAPAAPSEPDPNTGQAPVSAALASKQLGLSIVDAECFADPPAKAAAALTAGSPTVMTRFIGGLHLARREIVIMSPYFVPGERGLQQLRQARDAGVSVAVVTNALGASDEPLVSLSYGRYREGMLRMGVQLFEISSSRLKRDRDIGRLLGSSVGRLHAKVAFVDSELLMLGSLNMDARSAYINTELGVALRGAAFAAQVQKAMRVHDRRTGVFEVRLSPAGDIEWVARDATGEEVVIEEPESSMWQRLKLKLMGLLIPEALL